MTLEDIHAIIFQDIFLKGSNTLFLQLAIEQTVSLKSWNSRYGDNIVKFSVLILVFTTDAFHQSSLI